MGDEPNSHDNPVTLRRDLLDASDNDLVQELRRKNSEALAVLLDRYQRLVYTIAFRTVRNRTEAEDVVQDVFLEIFRKASIFDPAKAPFKVWLLRYAYTRSMDRRDHLERRRFYTNVELDDAGLAAPPTSLLFDSPLIGQEAAIFVRQALEALSANQRNAINLIALEGMTLEEAANALGQSLPATRNHYFRGIMALRASNTSQTISTAMEPGQPLEIGNEKKRVQHLRARTA